VAVAGGNGHLAPAALARHRLLVDDPLIERDEVVALLFNVGDIVELLRDLVALAGGEDGEGEQDD
jgi:hypothetical protein